MTERRSRLKDGGTSLAQLAEHLHLTKGTISAVLNDSPYAKSIPQRTKDRIIAAARELNYQPNFFARTLRKKKTFSIGVICADIGDPYTSAVISGVEAELSKHKYFFLSAVPRHDPVLTQQYIDLLLSRGVEGILAIDSYIPKVPDVPTAVVAGHSDRPGLTNIVLDHNHAAEQALDHLVGLGHKRIAVFRGQKESSDSEERWNSISEYAKKIGVPIAPELVVQLGGQDSSQQPGYNGMKELVGRKVEFTAVFAYNDLSAIGAIRYLHEVGLKVPDDISVLGFDDIREAAFHFPGLTTVRQPLRRMGEVAADAILRRIERSDAGEKYIQVEPEFVVRESTGAPVAGRVKSAWNK